MKALLCLLTGQHVPNLLAVHHFKPDQLVLIESSGMKRSEAAAKFLAALALGGLDYEGRCHVQPLSAEDNLDLIRQALREAYGRFPAAHWTANVTGGTKPMSLAAHEFFKALAGRVVYTNVTRPNEIIDLTTNEIERCGYRPSIKEFIAGYGFQLRKPETSVEEAERRALSWEAAARATAALGGEGIQLDLTRDGWRKARKKGMELRGELRIADPAARGAIAEALELRAEKDDLKGTLTKYGVEFLTGGWLEIFVWNQLRRHQTQLGLWDVRLGLEVGYSGATAGNDIDVSFMHNWQLCVVECKTGAQEHDQGGDVLYKLEAVINQFRALRVRSWLATTSANILNPDGSLKANVESRVTISGCTVIRCSQIEEMAERSEDSELLKEILFDGNRVAASGRNAAVVLSPPSPTPGE